MALTDAAIKNAKPAAKPFKLSDAGGLYLLVRPVCGELGVTQPQVTDTSRGSEIANDTR